MFALLCFEKWVERWVLKYVSVSLHGAQHSNSTEVPRRRQEDFILSLISLVLAGEFGELFKNASRENFGCSNTGENPKYLRVLSYNNHHVWSGPIIFRVGDAQDVVRLSFCRRAQVRFRQKNTTIFSTTNRGQEKRGAKQTTTAKNTQPPHQTKNCFIFFFEYNRCFRTAASLLFFFSLRAGLPHSPDIVLWCSLTVSCQWQAYAASVKQKIASYSFVKYFRHPYL